MVTGPPRSIASPCVQVCAVDGESGLCLGCFRTLKEIGAWRSFDDETRKTIMDELGERRQRIKPEKLAIFGEQDASRLACEAPPAPRRRLATTAGAAGPSRRRLSRKSVG